ncbi:hypothetical protein N8Z72_06500 [Polaribacter sp.]|nr:hypothetical protein [Polaribacter sp.]
MNQYTIKGFADILVTSTQFSKLKRREQKLLLLDRCNWFISAIVKDNIKTDKTYGTYVNLNSQILKKYLGDRAYKDIEQCLKGLGIIIINDKYSSSNFSKSFKLSPKAIQLGITETLVYSKKFITKLKTFSILNYSEIESQPVLKKLLNNTAKLLVVEEPFYYVERILPNSIYVETENGQIDISEPVNQFKVDRYDAFYSSFYALNEITDPKVLFDSSINYTPTIAKSGRIYHVIASMPKLIRESIRTKSNELIWEVDMSSAQPSIIFLEWLKWAKKNYTNKFKDEYELCLKLLLDGGIYKYIESNSEYFKGLEYKKLKESVLTVINDENKPTKQNKELSRLFPNVFKWINSIKKVNFKEVSFLGQSAEADIFVEVYKSIPDDKFALIIHDCILTTEKDVLLVKKLLEDRIRKLFDGVILEYHNLEKLFKTSEVSIRDELLEKTQRDAYSKKCQIERINS